jgi:hypothetical membrane protein
LSGFSVGIRIAASWPCAAALFVIATAVIVTGCLVSERSYPGGFDWSYMVISKLASGRRNPDGALWCSGAIVLATLLLSPLLVRLCAVSEPAGRVTKILTVLVMAGMAGAVLVGVEMLTGAHLDSMVWKGHEILALLTIACLFAGILGLYVQRMRRDVVYFWPALGVLLPILGTGIAALLLYLDQRSLGWVDHDWRRLGVSPGMSFAFWQWLAVTALWLGFGGLALIRRASAGGERSLRQEAPEHHAVDVH